MRRNGETPRKRSSPGFRATFKSRIRSKRRIAAAIVVGLSTPSSISPRWKISLIPVSWPATPQLREDAPICVSQFTAHSLRDLRFAVLRAERAEIEGREFVKTSSRADPKADPKYGNAAACLRAEKFIFSEVRPGGSPTMNIDALPPALRPRRVEGLGQSGLHAAAGMWQAQDRERRYLLESGSAHDWIRLSSVTRTAFSLIARASRYASVTCLCPCSLHWNDAVAFSHES